MVAKDDLETLVKFGILGRNEEGPQYFWTVQGIFMLPEYVFPVHVECPIINGDIANLLTQMLGDYQEVIGYIKDSLKVSKKRANEIFKLVLAECIIPYLVKGICF